MPVQNFECQIARAQISRYLAGESLGEDMLQQLESHVLKCIDCRIVLEQRKAALQSLIGQPSASPAVAVVEVEEEKPVRKNLRDWMLSKLPKPKKSEGKSITKPAVYAGGLALVLIGMSYFSNNLTTMMGPRASQTLDKPEEPVKDSASTGTIKSLAAKLSQVPKTKAPAPTTPVHVSPKKAAPPKVEISQKPVPDAPTPAVKRRPRHQTPSANTSTPAKDTIRVYGAN